ncbi:MAG TPA: peptide chain release factor N(5)-glutamine methyltransferase [Saprospiraceae bacterium]|nr:peptide chain release factor N(5)-glutamine methyltransferase [Saprospiraceae bacterium]HMP24104.1 peptide chain release factor N(5)-glutamine methyltransferase [Saprospiraceae bacterium]
MFEDALGIRGNWPEHEELNEVQLAHLELITKKLLTREPLQYVLGQADFYGLKFSVTPAVLIPRQETEELVAWVLETLKKQPDCQYVLDIGTGSGCIPIVIKKKRPDLSVATVDISPEALIIAKQNAALHHVAIDFIECNILHRSAWQLFSKYDCIISNPPYIPVQESALMPHQVKDFEPALALFVNDENPLVFYDAIADFSKIHLKPGGYLFFECNEFNAKKVVQMLEKKGFSDVILQKDLNGKDRMIRAQMGLWPTRVHYSTPQL